MPQQRLILDREIAQIRDDILRLTSMVDTAVDHAMLALTDLNVNLAREVIIGDDEINRLRHEIEETCLLTLATQQPAASDLRTIIAAIHLAVELERMGDHAAGIARLVTRLENEPSIDSLHKLPKMTKRARQMIQEAIQAFITQDAGLARNMIRRDDKLDRQYNKLFQETLEEMRDAEYIRRATYLLWVGHNLERIGDRATNIAERVIFMITGEFMENIDSDLP